MLYAGEDKVQKATFVIPVADLERGVKSVTWSIPLGWLENALSDAGATPVGEGAVLEVELSKNGSDILVRGYAEVSVTVPCVVTLEPLLYKLRPEIFLLLSPAPMASSSTLATRGAKRRAGSPGKAGRNGKKSSSEAWNQDPELGKRDAARDTFEGDKVVLDDFLREFIVLELPMYPRRSDLPSDQTPATGTPPPSSPQAGPGQTPLDPRLLPLAEIRDRLRQNKKE